MTQYPFKDYFKAFADQIRFGWRGRWLALRGYLERQHKGKLALWLASGAFTLVMLPLAIIYMGVRLGWYGPLPSQQDLAAIRNSQAAEIYSQDGVLLGKYYVENRVDVELEAIANSVIAALIATEDARFFTHRGVDFRALARVALKSIVLGDDSAGGGSTLSQQLAKNLYPRRRYRLFGMPKNKLWEMVVAARLEQVYDKEQLLLLYLNTVPFGDNTFGIKVAANRFFGLEPSALKAEQAALLVGMLKGNTVYNPRRHPEAATTRRNLVLKLMANNGDLPAQDLDSLQALPLGLAYRAEGQNQGLATHFRELLRQEVLALLAKNPAPSGKPYDLYRDGLRIYTSLDSRMQQHAEEAVAALLPQFQANLLKDWQKRDLPWESDFQHQVQQSPAYQKLAKAGYKPEKIRSELQKSKAMTIYDWRSGNAIDTLLSPLDSLRHYYSLLNVGLLATEASSARVKAWVGGVNYRFIQYDHVRSKRQVGSAIKPIVYAAALANGMRPCEYTPAERLTYQDYNNYNPSNPSGTYEGVYSMKGSLAKSINTVAVNIAVRTGLDQVANLAKKMGLKQEVKAIPSLALGTAEASLEEMVIAYSSFAQAGRRPHALHFLDKITTADGQTIVDLSTEQPSWTYVLNDSIAALSTFLMAGVVNSGTGSSLRSTYGLQGALAGKTGTTQNQRDGWFLGYTPRLVVGTWIGASYPAVHFRTLGRGSATATALPLWGSFMRRVAADKKLAKFQGGGFPALDEMTLALLQCPDYLDEMPVLGLDSLRGDVRLREVDPARLQEIVLSKPPREGESMEAYTARIERLLSREDRKEENREKRKEMWSKIFFGKKEEQ